MFKKEVLSLKDIFKKVNYELKSHFFSLEEFKLLSFRKAYKVIKLIIKIKKIKLKRSEIKSLVCSLQNIETKEKTTIFSLCKLFIWIKEQTHQKPRVFVISKIVQRLLFIFLYRKERQEIFRN